MEQNNINYKITAIEQREIWELEEVKNYLRVSHKNDDKLINNLIYSAIDYAEQFLGTSFFTKKITCSLQIATNYFRVKYTPILRVTNASLVNDQLKENITNDFRHVDIDREKIWIEKKYWNRKIEIDYEAGLGDNIPRTIMHGVLMHVGMMYDFGENSVNISSEIRDMYLPYRKFMV